MSFAPTVESDVRLILQEGNHNTVYIKSKNLATDIVIINFLTHIQYSIEPCTIVIIQKN